MFFALVGVGAFVFGVLILAGTPWESSGIGVQVKGIGAMFVLLGAGCFQQTKYRRWTFDANLGKAMIETYGVLGRSRQEVPLAEVQDVTVKVIGGRRPWNWFVLRKTDGTEARLGPTGRLGQGSGEKVTAAIRTTIRRARGPGNLPG